MVLNQFTLNRSLLFYPTTADQLVRQLRAAVTSTSTPWLVWTNGWGNWQTHTWHELEQRISGVSSDVVCVAVLGELPESSQPNKSYRPNHQRTSVILPVVWQTEWLRKRLSAPLPFVPSPQLLTFALYHQLQPIQQVNIAISDVAKKNQIQLGSAQERTLLDYTLPVLSCTAEDTKRAHATNAATIEKKPLTSVLVSTYNAGKRLSWAIQSVLSQDLHDWELIVIDDGSTDRTQELLQTFSDERLYVVRQPVNRGKAHALNEGLRIASGRYICELDADDWLAPEALEVFTREMESRNDAVSILSGSYHLWIEDSRGRIIYKRKVEPQRFAWNEQSATPPIPRFYRTRSLREIGGWPVDDPSSGRLFEDVAVCTKMVSRHKYAIQVINQALYHRILRRASISQQHRAVYSEWAKEWRAQLTEESERNRHSEREP